MKYTVYTRYERWTANGKEFCKWYHNSNLFDTEDEAKESLNKLKETTKSIDKHTKLKHEFEIRYIDETLLLQTKMKIHKGRYKKISEETLDDICKKLYKSKNGITPIDTSIGVYIYNTEAHRNYIQEKIDKKYKSEKWAHFWYDTDNNNTCYVMLKDKNAKILVD